MKKIIFFIIFIYTVYYSFNEFMIQEAIGQEQTETGETETTQEELEDSCE